jgi:hypothetical protein
MRNVQRVAGGVAALAAGALIVFGTVKGTQPSGEAVPYVLAALFSCAAAVWLTMLPVGKLNDQVDRLENERYVVKSERDALKGGRDALQETSGTLRTERDQAQGALRNLQTEAETAGAPRLPQVVRGRAIRLADLPPWVYKRTFEDCELIGPGPAWIGPSQRVRCTLLGLTSDSFLEAGDISVLPPGAVRFIDCKLVNCELQSLVMVGNREQIAQLRKEFRE